MTKRFVSGQWPQASRLNPMPEWGVTPAEASARLLALEWQNVDNLRARLAGERSFPITVALKPPPGTKAVADVARFGTFVQAWLSHPLRDRVIFESRAMRGFQEQQVPVRLELRSMDELAVLLGPRHQEQLGRWQSRIEAVSGAMPGARREAIRRLREIDELDDDVFAELLCLLPQLKAGTGNGAYVRALPLAGVGSKFIEEHAALLEALVRASERNDELQLFAWLGVLAPPTGTVLIRTLDPALAHLFGGLAILWTASQQVERIRCGTPRVVIVENAQSVLCLPAATNTIAIGATGRDLSWLSAPWLRGCRCCYWGDMDSWGYHLLEVARQHIPELPSLLMDIDTLVANAARRSSEPGPFDGPLGARLTQAELEALKELRRSPGRQRLEQEKLPVRTVELVFASWLEGQPGE